MAEIYTELSTTFTTADTEGPVTITFRENALTVEFSNFRNAGQKVVFHDTRAFSWSGWDGTSEKLSPDRVYQVDGSALLAPWIGFAVQKRPFLHFQLGFNAEGKYLDVIATRMEHLNS